MRKPSVNSSSAGEDLLVVNEFAISLLQQETLDDLLWMMAQNLGRLMDLEDCVIYLVHGQHLVQKAAYGAKNPRLREIAAPLSLPIHAGITGAAVATGLPQRVDDTREDPRYIRDKQVGLSELAVPIIWNDKVIAVLDSEASRVRAFSDAQEALMVSCANIAASRIATAIEEAQRRRAEQALAEANARLEERVEARTRALQEAIEQLNHQVAERERLQEEVLKGRKLESLGVLAGGIAHDFNNMLQGILAHLNQARLAVVTDPDDAANCLDRAEQACTRARGLTQQLQTFARGGSLVKRVQTITGVLEETVEFVLRGRNVHAELDLAQDLHPVAIDADQMSQVIQNLVLNAAQAMPGGGTIYVAARNAHMPPALADGDSSGSRGRGGESPRGAPAVHITVRDEGPGISSDALHNVFDPYFTTKVDGTGMGLASAHGIVADHGGQLIIDDTYTGGASFIVVLQAADGAVDSADTKVSDHGVPLLRVLLMDDEAMVLDATAGLLRRMGIRVAEAADGEAALQLFADAVAEGDPFDAALLDLTVPGRMGGIEALSRLRKLDDELPAAVISGYSNTDAVAKPELYGFQEALRKPFRIDDLKRALWTLARHRPKPPQ